MQSIFRLDSVSPTLAEEFRNAPALKRRQAALIACELAVSSAGLEDEAAAAIATLRRGGTPSPAIREQLESMAARFDDEYLRLAEEGDQAITAEVLLLFSKARAASALAFALREEAAELHEAIYEARAAVADPTQLVAVVERALQ